MNSIGICGNFSFGSEAVGGQTIRTRSIKEALEKSLSNEIICVDTQNWRSNPFGFLLRLINMIINSKNVIILPAQNGIKVILPLVAILTKLLGKRLHHVVIGGWLYDCYNTNKWLIPFAKMATGVYCQTNTIIANLSKLHISRTYHLPNFKYINTLKEDELELNYKKPYKLCFLSRINYKKGVEDAVDVVKRINAENAEEILELDIYGPVEESYKERFNLLMTEAPSSIRYRGTVEYNNTVEVISKYFLFLFPTRYRTEGTPGTLIDAFSAGVPILASRWESCAELIDEGVTGITYEIENKEELYNKLKLITQDKETIIRMKLNCLRKANDFLPNRALKSLFDNLKI